MKPVYFVFWSHLGKFIYDQKLTHDNVTKNKERNYSCNSLEHV